MYQELLNKIRSSDNEIQYEGECELISREYSVNDIPFLADLIAEDNRSARNIAVNSLLSINDYSIPQYLVKYISSSDISIRNLAGELLIKFGSCSVPVLIKFLKICTDSDDKKFAIDILGYIGSLNCENDLIDIIKHTSNENVILSCIEAFGNIRSESSIDVLKELYGKNILFDSTIVEALGKIGNKEASNFIFTQYNAADEIVKYSIVESFGEIGDEEIFFFLLSELNDSSGLLSWIILKSIFKLKNKYNLDVPFDDRMKNLVMEAAQEADQETRKSALIMLSDFNDKESILLCLKNYGSDPELDEILKEKLEYNKNIVFRNIHNYLISTHDNLLQLLLFANELLMNFREMSEELSEVEKRVLVSAVTDILSDSREEVRYSAQEFLFNFDRNTALLFSDVMLTDFSIWNKLRLLELLSDIDFSQTEDILEKMSNDPDEMVRERVAQLIYLNKGKDASR